VLPLRPGSKEPASEHGLLDATTDPERIEAWWSRWPEANIGIRCDGLFLLDIDGADNPWLAGDPDRQVELAAAPCSRTPGGGRHVLMRPPAGVRVRNSAGRVATRVDVRGDGGYFVAPPSRIKAGGYAWVEGELDVGPEGLPEPPSWLLEAATKPVVEPAGVPTVPGRGNSIPEGVRNDTLASLAGTMRRRGMTQSEIAAALRVVNAERCRPPMDDDEVDRIAKSIAAKPPDAVSVALSEHHWEQDHPSAIARPRSVRELREAFPSLRPPVIEGVLRRGETMNVISSPKVGKSWLVLDLAMSVATGRRWLGAYDTHAGDVLIIDNELHPETSSHRLPRVAEARGIPMGEIDETVFVHNLRGQLRDIVSFSAFFDTLNPGEYSLIVLDAFYRFMPAGGDENDNGQMAAIYNHIDRYADRLGCCFVLIHHSTKGNQSGKSVTDVGAGAGSQSRATDTHLVLRPHEEPGAVVLEAAVRSWPPLEPKCLRWSFPVWNPADDLDPTQLKGEKPRKPREGAEPWTGERFALEFGDVMPRDRLDVLHAAKEAGLPERHAIRLLREAERQGHLYRWEEGRNRPVRFATVPPLGGEEAGQ
jgi:hypothetical protein